MRAANRLGLLAAFSAAAHSAPALTADLSSLHMKSGLWEIVSQSTLRKEKELGRMCADASVEQKLIELLTHSTMSCPNFDVQMSGHTVTVGSQCSNHGTTCFFHSVTIFEGDRAAHTEDRVQYRPPLFGMSTYVIKTDAKWVGACPDDIKPSENIWWSSSSPQNSRKFNLPPPAVIRGTTPGR